MIVWLAFAGGIGAVTRFMSDGILRALLGREFPWATMIINIVGSFILGSLTGLLFAHRIDNTTILLMGTGFCGGFTTFSTASFETARLLEEHRWAAAFFQVFGNLCLSILAAWVGFCLLSRL